MPREINTPIGKINRPTAYIAVAAGGAALFIAYRSNKKKKAAAAAAASNPVANAYGYGTNQYAYGTGTGAYGYGAYTYQPYGYGYGPYGLGSYGGGSFSGYGYGYYGAGTPVPAQVPQQATTNAEWSQAALTALTAQGYVGQTILGALGPYLAGKPLDSGQVQIVQAAIAVEGYPPIPGASGNPPGIASAGGGGGGGGQHSNVTVPKVEGLTVNNAQAILREVGLQTRAGAGTSGYIVTSTNPPAGASVKPGTSITIHSRK